MADVISDLYVDLSLPLEDIHGSIRKSYRALINKAEKLWQVKILDFVSKEEWDDYHKMHVEVAGRSTRSDETWDLQKKSINDGHGFLVKLSDDKDSFVGGGFFQYSRDECVYAVGVYDRSLFDQPVSHLVQWNAIKHMKELRLKWYKIGQRFWSGKTMSLVEPTEKELQISYFKEGFATNFEDTIIITNHF